MTRTDRRLLAHTGLLGTGLTLLVGGAVLSGWLAPLERRLSDRRSRDFQFFNPTPTDRLVHLDIDDPSLDAIGAWPWKRSTLAGIIDELHIAGAKAVALDILFPEAAPPEIVEDPPGAYRTIHHDENFATAIRRNGSVLIPLSLTIEQAIPPQRADIVMALEENLERTIEQTRTAVANRRGKPLPQIDISTSTYIIARREAMRRRIRKAMDADPDIEKTVLQSLLLPHAVTTITHTPEIRLFENQFAKHVAMRMLQRFARPASDHEGPLIRTRANFPPISRISREIAQTGFVDYDPDPDGVIRSIPLWVACGEHLYPQLGLALACMTLGIGPETLILDSHQVRWPAGQNAPAAIPVRREASIPGRDTAGMIMDIPWFGPTGSWPRMYGNFGAQHLPAVKVWEVRQTTEKIIYNNRNLDHALMAIFALADETMLEEMKQTPIDADDFDARQPRIAIAIDTAAFILPMFGEGTPKDLEREAGLAREAEQQRLESLLRSLPGLDDDAMDQSLATLDPDDAEHLRMFMDPATLAAYLERFEDSTRVMYERFVEATDAVPTFVEENTALVEQLRAGRHTLREQLQGRAVLMGWTALGKVDYKVTPLHPRCPGHVIHGVIFNAIMTGHVLRHLADHYATIVTLLIGLVATACAAWLTPVRALIAAIALAGAYWVVNGLLLYDYAGLLLQAAGPTTVVGIVWGGCTVYRFVIERRERTRITRRFSSYVDPALVNYVVEHSEQVRLDGQIRELSVVFTDLAGFTTLSERLQERTVPLLNDYMGRMVPVIREHNGYVNKFLGDGMMFFYGAPRENDDHASDAVATVLDMQLLMKSFNQELISDGLPEVSMRAGISSGEMVVGDAGSADASDYTVLGDTVNLAARLESANKVTGTDILINDRTATLVGERFLLRPVGRLQVVGKTQGVMVYEPLTTTEHAMDEHLRVVALSRAVVDAYQQADINGCLAAIGAAEKAIGSHKLTDLYRRECAALKRTPPGDAFNGCIVLTEK